MNREAPEFGDLLFPLSTLEATAEGHGPLRADVLAGDRVPQPYRALLVHDTDMTSTLESHFDQPLALRLLHKRVEGDVMMREVLLIGTRDGRALEYGAIRIELSRFPGDVRKQIEACVKPLGGILRESGFVFHSKPSAFLKVRPDRVLNAALGASPDAPLYGRRNTLTTGDGAVIAQILEILPPLADVRESA